jgi:hypothetical protein
MKKIILCFLCIFLMTCNREQKVQELQQKYKEVYPIESIDKYLCLDNQGNVHLVSYYPYSDIIVFYNADIENALLRDFKKENMTQ